jgi:hypothetical protein
MPSASPGWCHESHAGIYHVICLSSGAWIQPSVDACQYLAMPSTPSWAPRPPSRTLMHSYLPPIACSHSQGLALSLYLVLDHKQAMQLVPTTPAYTSGRLLRLQNCHAHLAAPCCTVACLPLLAHTLKDKQCHYIWFIITNKPCSWSPPPLPTPVGHCCGFRTATPT